MNEVLSKPHSQTFSPGPSEFAATSIVIACAAIGIQKIIWPTSQFNLVGLAAGCVIGLAASTFVVPVLPQ